jgi:hypothetical protein
MKNALFAMSSALALALVIVGVFAYRQTAGLKTQVEDSAAQVRELKAKLAARTASDALDLTARCAKQAAEMFRYSGLDKNQMGGYISHYNPKLGKCFIQTGSMATFGKTLWTYKTLFDAFEQKQYGDYSWHTDPVKKAWEVPPFTCTVTMPSGEEVFCKSDAEFEQLIKVYME